MGTEGGAAARAVGRNFITLVYQPFVPHLFHRPPNRLNICTIHRDVGMFKVNPVANSFGEAVPFFQIFKDAVPAFGVELLYTVSFDLRLAGKAELFFHFQFNR